MRLKWKKINKRNQLLTYNMFLTRLFWVVILTCSALSSTFAAPTVAAGKDLFTANCAACHNKNMKDDLTGPALKGVQDRWADKKDLYKWIRGSQALVAAGNPRAVELFNKWKSPMTNFPNFTDEQIESLLMYIDATANAAPAKPAGQADQAGGTSENGESNFLWYALVTVLGLLAIALMRIISNLNNIQRVQGGLTPEKPSLRKSLSTMGAIATIIFCAVLVLGYKMVDNATKMGRTQNYQPEQPINFSHKIHAGINKIDCQYCHDGARRTKAAVIPAANTCMNCHSAVKKGTNTNTAEITKIYASIGFDPIAGKYIPDYDNWSEQQIQDLYTKWISQNYMADNSLTSMNDAGKAHVDSQWEGILAALKNDSNGKIQGPIEWVRIHNLPDHVYFNHSQHVAIGQVACQKCHGKIEEMDVVKQYSTLGMGWCVNCHRETEVKFNDNKFYDQYVLYHKELKSKEKEKVTVEDIGGLECQKCHY